MNEAAQKTRQDGQGNRVPHGIPVKQNLLLISCVCVAEPFSSVILLPFIYFMVKDFGYEESEIGSHAGIISELPSPNTHKRHA